MNVMWKPVLIIDLNEAVQVEMTKKISSIFFNRTAIRQKKKSSYEEKKVK